MSCRNCTWLDVAPDKAGRFTALRGYTYECKAPETEMPAFPSSVIKRYGFSWPPLRSWMRANDGEGCMAFVVRTKPALMSNAPLEARGAAASHSKRLLDDTGEKA